MICTYWKLFWRFDQVCLLVNIFNQFTIQWCNKLLTYISFQALTLILFKFFQLRAGNIYLYSMIHWTFFQIRKIHCKCGSSQTPKSQLCIYQTKSVQQNRTRGTIRQNSGTMRQPYDHLMIDLRPSKPDLWYSFSTFLSKFFEPNLRTESWFSYCVCYWQTHRINDIKLHILVWTNLQLSSMRDEKGCSGYKNCGENRTAQTGSIGFR